VRLSSPGSATSLRARPLERCALEAIGVGTPAQALLVVVPVDSHLEIEAMVSNRDRDQGRYI
jgi:hypothetical protein